MAMPSILEICLVVLMVGVGLRSLFEPSELLRDTQSKLSDDMCYL